MGENPLSTDYTMDDLKIFPSWMTQGAELYAKATKT